MGEGEEECKVVVKMSYIRCTVYCSVCNKNVLIK